MSNRKLVWAPSILSALIEGYQSGLSPEQIWELIQKSADKNDLEYFCSHFEKKSKKLDQDSSQIILKRIKNEISSAKQIIPLGDKALSDWTNNVGKSRTYAWRKQKRAELFEGIK